MAAREPVWAALIFAVYFVVLWLLVTWLLGHLSGWVKLAGHYPASGPREGTLVRLRVVRMGQGWIGQFRNVVTAFAGVNGMRLRMQFLFRVNSPDIFIPSLYVKVSRGHAFLVDYMDLTFARAPDIPLRIWGKRGERLREAAGAVWPEAPRVT